jgi:hypothetical protein
MHQKDYILKHIERFSNALHEIVLNIENKDHVKAQKQIAISYLFFNNSASFFVASEVSEIVHFLNKEENGLEKINVLAELFIVDAKINLYRRNTMLHKAIFLLEYYAKEMKTISFNTLNTLSKAKNLLAEVS